MLKFQLPFKDFYKKLSRIHNNCLRDKEMFNVRIDKQHFKEKSLKWDSAIINVVNII